MCTLKQKINVFISFPFVRVTPLIRQCHLSGALLHICDRVGSGAVHALRHPALRLCHPAVCGSLHLCGAHLLPAFGRRLPLVVAKHPEYGIHRPIHICLLAFLLLESVEHERSSAEHGVLRLFLTHRVRVLTHARDCFVLGLAGIYPLHLSQPEDGLNDAGCNNIHALAPPPHPFLFFLPPLPVAGRFVVKLFFGRQNRRGLFFREMEYKPSL